MECGDDDVVRFGGDGCQWNRSSKSFMYIQM